MDHSYNKETFCVAPWVSTHLSTFEDILPCCLFKRDRSFGKLKKGDSLESHYNSENAISVRKDLWNGVKIPECNECWYREEVSTIEEEDNKNSYRNNLWRRFKHHIDDIVNNTNEDFTIKEVKFKMMDLRFDNKCNLRCRICSPSFSSALYKEYKDLGFNNFLDTGSPYNISVDDNEFNSIINQLHTVEVLFFAGGEPLTQDRYYEILQYCIDNDLAKNITLWVTTNFTKLFYKNYNTIEMWKHFKDVEITASIDGNGERGEYLRKGCKWEDIINNRELLLKELPKVRFIIVPTVNLMNGYNVISLYKEWINKKYIDFSSVNFNLLTHPAHLQLKNLPEHHKVKLRNLYLETIDWIKSFDVEHTNLDIDQFHFLISLLEIPASKNELDTFVERTLQVDKYRGDDFFGIFTEYRDILDNYLESRK